MKNTYLSELTIPKSTDYRVKDNETNCLENLSKVNLFIGQNNSGKSRFVRKLFADFNTLLDVEIKYNLRTFEKEKLTKIINDYLNDKLESNRNAPINSENRFDSIIENQKTSLIEILHFLESRESLINCNTDIRKIVQLLIDSHNSNRNEYQKIAIKGEFGIEQYTFEELQILDMMDEVRKDLLDNLAELTDKKRKTTYIPSLRTIRNLGHSSSFLKGISAKQHFENTNFMESIFTGENMFAEINRLKTSKNKELKELEHFEKFISKTFFNNSDLKLFAPIESNQEKQELHLKIGEDEEYPISQLGDGIQQVILLTYPLFLDTDKEHLVFLDEPELHLHPGFQRIFLDTIKNEFSNCQFFIATHSNHFLDLTIEQESNTSIFTFQKELVDSVSTFTIQNVSSPDHSVLDLIGVKNSSVFLTNCTIWVEGITDRLYIQKFLEIYQREFKKDKIYREDINFSFVEYGGANITHWSFIDEKDNLKNINVERLCGKAFLITDNDGATETNKAFKKERFEKLKTKLDGNYECLNCREIENLLSPNILSETISIYEKNLGNEDFKINDFRIEDYRNEPLGTFINEKVFVTSKIRKTYSNESGTLNDKLTFCKRALDLIKTIDDLHPDAKMLCEKIYQFIASKNK